MSDNPLLARFVEQPSMVAPEWSQIMEANITLFVQNPHANEMLAIGDANAADDSFWPEADSWMASVRPYNVNNGILTIPISGVMLNNFSFGTSWATGYQYIDKAFTRGMADPDVKGIALSINSGGGDAAGNIDLCDKMIGQKSKPVVAVCEYACSAAYAIACAADSIEMSRTGVVGSIGVVMGHMDASEAMKQRGIKMTFVSAPEGGDKTDGNSTEPLSAAARGRMQDRCDEIYQHFATLVSQNRPMDEKAVRGTKARTFSASQATSNGLADKVASAESSMANFSAALSSNGEERMSTENSGTVTAAAHEAAIASATQTATAAGATAERARISAIIAHAEAKDRPVAALALAMDSDMSVDAAASLLAKLPKETPAAVAAPAAAVQAADPAHVRPDFGANMNKQGGANIPPNAETGADGQVDLGQAALALSRAHGMPGLRSAPTA